MVKFSRDSWHYKLANFGSDRVAYWLETDICSYSRKVFAGFITFVMITFLCCVLLGIIALAVYEHYMWFTDQGSFGPAAFLVDGTIILIGGIALIEVFKHKIRRYSNQRYWDKLTGVKKTKPDNFLVTLYKKFKDKTCYKVTFDEDCSRE